MEKAASNFWRDHPRKLDYAVILTLASMLVGAGLYIVTSELASHNHSETAHPALTEQLDRVEAQQIRKSALDIDLRLCDDPSNVVYRRELARLISEYEKLTGRTFPRELLTCSRGSNG